VQHFILLTAIALQLCTREGRGTAQVKAGGKAGQGVLAMPTLLV